MSSLSELGFNTVTGVERLPGGVSSLEEIIPGRSFVHHNRDGALPKVYAIAADPSQDEDGTWWVEVLGGGRICLSDHGVVPYPNGLWNQLNYLVPAE